MKKCQGVSAAEHQCTAAGLQVVRRTWDWLAEQPEDAAELAVLLFEAAPRLKISASGSGGTSRPPKASRRASYKDEDGSRHRLSAAVPCPTGAIPLLHASAAQNSENS